MSRKITYRAAKEVAEAIENHFAQLVQAAHELGEEILMPAPSKKVIEAMIDTAFWASLRREEGHSPRISLALLPPEQSPNPLLFKKRLPLLSRVLTKLGPGVERPGVHLGVWYIDDTFYIWGTTHEIPSLGLVLDVSEPGLLVIKHRRKDGFGKFANVAVLIGDQVKVVDEQSASLPDCPDLLSSLLGFTSPSSFQKSVNVLVQLATSMRAHHHGGLLLVVPADSESWRRSIIHPMTYEIAPSYSGLANLMKQDAGDREQSLWQGALRREIDSLAGLTAIDGATVITDQHELLAFGAKIGRPEGSSFVEQIIITEPVVGNQAQIVHPSQSGGTRHLSAAQFVHDQRDALALVASQDGRFTVFSWSPCEGMVHAHRIDTLLL